MFISVFKKSILKLVREDDYEYFYILSFQK